MSVDFKVSFDLEPQRRRRATTADANHANFRRFDSKKTLQQVQSDDM